MSGGSSLGRMTWAAVPALAAVALHVSAGVAGAQNGTITGAVTNQNGGAPLSGVAVLACTPTGGCTGTTTNASGVYAISRPPGPNYVYTAATGDFVNEIYNDLACGDACASTFTRGSTVVVSSNTTASQRDFALAPGGRITGRILDAATGGPLAGTIVRTFREGGTGWVNVASATTDAGGNYLLSRLPAGRYQVGTASETHVDEFLGDVMCPVDCDRLPTSFRGTPVDVTSGVTAGGHNFILAPGATVTGRITNRVTGQPISSIGPTLFTRVEGQVLTAGFARADQTGAYTVRGLAPGSYGAAVYGQQIGYVDETYDNLRCLGGCRPDFVMNSGQPLAVGAGAARGGIDFALDRTGGISGRITDATSGQPMQQVLLGFYRLEGDRLTYEAAAFTLADGTYAWPALPPGTYYVLARSTISMSETYPNVPCPLPCGGPDVALGSPLAVAADAQLTGIDFVLDRGARISGVVADTAGAALSATVRAYRRVGNTAELVHEVRTAPTFEQLGAAGSYTLGGLPPGTYYLVARSVSGIYIDELFGGAACTGCSGPEVFDASPLAVSATGGAAANFALAIGLNVSGTVRDAAGAQPLAGITVNAYDVFQPSRVVASDVSGVDGRFVIRGLPGSPHVFATAGASRYLHEVFNDKPCPGSVCDAPFAAGVGTSQSQPAGFSVFNINFALATRDAPPDPPTGLTASAQGSVAHIAWGAAVTGVPATSYVLEAGLSPGTTAASLPVPTPSFSTPGLAAGIYYLRVRGVNAYGTGAPSAEFPLIVLGNGASPPPVPEQVEAWTIGDRLTMSWRDPQPGARPTGYQVEAGTAPGATNIAAIDIAARNFTFEGTPPGFYFLRVRSRLAGLLSEPSTEHMVVVGGVPAPPGPPSGLTSSVAGSTVTFTWSPPADAAPSGYVLEAGSGPGLKNLAVFDTGSVTTTLVVPGVPRGAYFVRLRARNVLGAGLASNERVVIVP
jgi:5-hydroxyisourate hydrolase-like protein (transthyretin family)